MATKEIDPMKQSEKISRDEYGSRRPAGVDPATLLHKLKELAHENRVMKNQLLRMIKEKQCNFKFIELVQFNPMEKIMQGMPRILAESWQHHEVACARVLFKDREFRTENFKATRWKQATDVFANGSKIAQLEVYYTKKMPTRDEGPFLKEERALLDSLARRLGKIAERHHFKKQVEAEKAALNNMNIALREVLAKIQDEKNHIREDVQTNVDKIIMPLLHKLEMNLSPAEKKPVGLIRENLKKITSPFSSRLSREFTSLTPAEINICSMIKNGLSTKEIARLRHISPATVSKQRESIRRKLSLANQKINLVAYLDTYMNGL